MTFVYCRNWLTFSTHSSSIDLPLKIYNLMSWILWFVPQNYGTDRQVTAQIGWFRYQFEQKCIRIDIATFQPGRNHTAIPILVVSYIRSKMALSLSCWNHNKVEWPILLFENGGVRFKSLHLTYLCLNRLIDLWRAQRQPDSAIMYT